jgi:hypothetical protein
MPFTKEEIEQIVQAVVQATGTTQSAVTTQETGAVGHERVAQPENRHG